MPRKYVRKTKRANYSKEALEMAVQRINNKELSYLAASKLYGIPTSTLSDRVLKKSAVVSKTLGRSTAIPIESENKLANCLRTMEKWGWGLSRDEILDITQEFVNKNQIDTPFKYGRPGKDWFISFRQRHNLSIKKPQPVEYLRKKMTDPFIIHDYFNILKNTLQDLNLTDPNRIWNLDETSVCLDPTKTKVVGARGKPSTRTTFGSAKENISVLTTVNAAGKKLDPLIIYKGKYMYEQWMLETSESQLYDFNLAYASSKRGWMETEIFYNYMSNVLIPNLGEERPVLLLYDGHVSHVDDKVISLAVENNITIIKLPAHTSHLLQPLDLTVFKSFKAIWDKKLVMWQRQNVGSKLKKQYFAKMFAEAWQNTSPEVIKNGFKKGGIYPFNSAVIPKEKFCPGAYARWQKYILPKTFKQPKTLNHLCLEEINKALSSHNTSNSVPNTAVTYSNTTVQESLESELQTINISFEKLLLDKVAHHSQNTDNNRAPKLKRVAKGAEVITKMIVEKQQEQAQQEVHKTRQKKKFNKKQQNGSTKIDQSSIYADPQPGPSGIQTKNNLSPSQPDVHDTGPKPGPSAAQKINSKAKNNNSQVMADKTNIDRYISKKGKGIGKRSRVDKENILTNNLNDNIMIDLTNPNVENLNAKSNASKILSKSSKGKSTKKPVKKRKRTYSTATTIESIQMSEHSDSDIFDSLSDTIWFDDTYNNSEQENIRKQEIEQIVKEIHEMDKKMEEMNKKYEHNDHTIVTPLAAAKSMPENWSFYSYKISEPGLDPFTERQQINDSPEIYDIRNQQNQLHKTTNIFEESNKIENFQSDNNGKKVNIQGDGKKVMVLSSVEISPELVTAPRKICTRYLKPFDPKHDLILNNISKIKPKNADNPIEEKGRDGVTLLKSTDKTKNIIPKKRPKSNNPKDENKDRDREDVILQKSTNETDNIIPKKRSKSNKSKDKNIDKDREDVILQKSTNETDNIIPKKRSKCNKSKDENIDRDRGKQEHKDLKTYTVGDTVLVRYFNKGWRYYVGVIEAFANVDMQLDKKMYTITFYKAIGKKDNLKFVIPSRKDQDCVPDCNIVKKIELLQIKENPVEYTLMDDDDENLFF